MKVVIVTSEYPPFVDDKSGLGSHSRTLARALANIGCGVVVVTYTDGLRREQDDHGVNVLIVGGVSSRETTDGYGARMRDINSHVAQTAIQHLGTKMFHPDVIHVQGSYGIYTGELLAKSLRCPLVGTAHLLHQSLFSAVAAAAPSYLVDFDRRLCESVDILITVSSFLASEVRELGLRPKKPICVIQNGTSAPSTRGNQPDLVDRCPGGSSPARRDIVTVGRLVPQKGVLHLLQSAAIVIDECPRLRYLVIGARYDEPFCRTLDSYLAERPAVRQAVVFLGAMPQDEIWDFYRKSYMVVLPSLYESFGLSALEAMYCGAPVIASAVGGLEEVIVHENSGLLLKPILTDGSLSIDPAALAQLQLRLLRDPELAKQMGANGAERARTFFSEESMAIHTIACYELALAQAVTPN